MFLLKSSIGCYKIIGEEKFENLEHDGNQNVIFKETLIFLFASNLVILGKFTIEMGRKDAGSPHTEKQNIFS